MKKLLRYFYGILPFFAAEAIQVAVVNIIYTAFVFLAGFRSGSNPFLSVAADTAEQIVGHDTEYMISVFGVLVCGAVFYFWYHNEVLGEVRGDLKQLLTAKNIGLFLLLGIGCQFFSSGIMSMLQQYLKESFTDYAKQVQELTSGNDIVVLLLMLVIAPVTEELVFRGVILHKTGREIPFLGANILQALLFGIYHWNIIQGVYAAVIGFLFGVVYRKYRTILAPILLHMIINASSFLILILPEGKPGYMFITVAGGTSILLSLFFIKPLREIAMKTSA